MLCFTILMLLYPAFSLEKAIPKGEARRVYGTLGDAHLQREIRRTLIGALLDDDSRDFNFDELDGESAKVADVVGACGNLPFLSERRVVLVRRAEKIENIARSEEKKDTKAKGPSAAKRRADGIAALPPTTFLFLPRPPETPDAGAKK